MIEPCDKDRVKKMEKEAKRREKEAQKQWYEIRKRKFLGEEIEEVEEEEPIPILTPICHTEGIPYMNFWTTVGSVVYCFGSEKNSSGSWGRTVRYWDLLNVEKGLEQGPLMINRRMLGNAVTLGGNIYVFGGTKASTKPWAEVLESYEDDMHNGSKWKALKEPPISIHSEHVFALPLEDGVRILVGSLCEDGLYSYDVSSNSWDEIDKQFSIKGACYAKPVVVGNALYWVGFEIIWAYDLDTKVYFSGRTHFFAVKSALSTVKELCLAYRLPFLHLYDDMFCLVWTQPDYRCGRPLLLVCLSQVACFEAFGPRERRMFFDCKDNIHRIFSH